MRRKFTTSVDVRVRDSAARDVRFDRGGRRFGGARLRATAFDFAAAFGPASVLAFAIVSLVGIGSAKASAETTSNEEAPAVVRVEGAVFRPFFNAQTENGEAPVEEPPLPTFWLDAYPVSQRAFAQFVLENPQWGPDDIPEIFANERYLAGWTGGDVARLASDPAASRYAVTGVSYFAASAFCSSAGGTLPSEAQWEAVASADENARNPADRTSGTRRVLNWYSRTDGEAEPTSDPPIGRNAPNAWGVYDLHGLIWEWVSDFNASIVDPRSRSANELEEAADELGLFCGGASIAASDPADYASFMRYAFRSSLTGRYAHRSLGFRCAYSDRNAAESAPHVIDIHSGE